MSFSSSRESRCAYILRSSLPLSPQRCPPCSLSQPHSLAPPFSPCALSVASVSLSGRASQNAPPPGRLAFQRTCAALSESHIPSGRSEWAREHGRWRARRDPSLIFLFYLTYVYSPSFPQSLVPSDQARQRGQWRDHHLSSLVSPKLPSSFACVYRKNLHCRDARFWNVRESKRESM